jgi:hypothetical protein
MMAWRIASERLRPVDSQLRQGAQRILVEAEADDN